MNILILRVSAIGDVIHTLPAIFLIKKVYPQAKISWIVQKKAAKLLSNQPFLENVWVLPDKFLHSKNWGVTIKTIQIMRKTRWDAILDFQGILKTSTLLLFLKGEKYGFDSNNSRLWLTSIFTSKHTTPAYSNIIQKNLALVSNMLQDKKTPGAKACPTVDSLKNSFQLQIPENKKQRVDSWLQQNKIEKFTILAPNTTWPSKLWPQENWEKLIQLSSKNSDMPLVLIGKDFGDQAKNLADKAIDQKIKNVHIFPKCDLLTTCYLISKSELLLAPDTGLLHIADFLGKKTIGIFGPTSAKKHGPFLTKENVVNVIQIKCPHHYQKTHAEEKSKPSLWKLPPPLKLPPSPRLWWTRRRTGRSISKNNKKDSIQDNCMYKLSPESLFEKNLKILDE